MKIIKKILITVGIIIFVLLFAKYSWDAFFSNFFTWTKTSFKDYQEYTELLDNHLFYANYYFVEEIPTESADTKYYVKRSFEKKYAAHSMVLTENYEKIAEERIVSYLESCSDNPGRLIYTLQENRWGMDDLKQAGAEVDYIQNVMQNPDKLQEYYCLVVIKMGMDRRIYAGVILNDTTKEVIEFSVTVPESKQPVEDLAETEEKKSLINTMIDPIIVIFEMLWFIIKKCFEQIQK